MLCGALATGLLCAGAAGQESSQSSGQGSSSPSPTKAAHKASTTRAKRSTATSTPTSSKGEVASGKKFVLDVLHAAVALPQANRQDRLRVLSAALPIARPVDSTLARQLAVEGAGLEAEVISGGETPAASVMAVGDADCKASAEFVDHIYPQSVAVAEQSLIGALGSCSKTTGEAIRQKVDAAMAQGIIAPRLMMALIDSSGPKSPWSQEHFTRLFKSLPDPQSETAKKEAANYAAMYSTMAPQVDKDTARDTGLAYLLWAGKMENVPERNLGVKIVSEAMKGSLGEQGMTDALAKDVMARQAIDQASQGPQEIERPQEENASVLQAMGQTGTDQTQALQELPSTMRAKQAAANGFATGTSGDKRGAEHYFDIAFSATDESWSARNGHDNMAPLVQEVCEAAAQVDPISALARAQKLQDPTAQAIGMLAVAQVVASKDLK